MELDIQSLREKLLPIALEMENVFHYRIDVVLLFGSHAKQTNTPESDIDLAFVSKDFGKDRIAEGALLSRLLFRKVTNSDPVPVSLKEYLDPHCISPIVAEIKKYSKIIF